MRHLPIGHMTIDEIKKCYINKEFSVKEIISGYLQRIDSLDGCVGAFITVCDDTALKAAGELDERLALGEDIGPLGGIPVAIKDNICTRGIETTCASKVLAGYIPPYDATAVKRLKEAGAIIIGKTNMDEFAMGSSTENSAVKLTRNPWDLKKVPGGSSGGSAAAVAAGFAQLSLGTDTGGSIRQPASFCGVVGLKPTYGAISRYGLIAFASSLDHIGPMARNIKDCAAAFEVMRGYDTHDSTSAHNVPSSGSSGASCFSDIEEGIKGLRVGVPEECFGTATDNEVADAVLASAKLLEKLGAKVEKFSLPVFDPGLSAYQIISSAEASSNLSRYDGIRYGYRTDDFRDIDELMTGTRTEGFGREVKRRIMLGTYVLSSNGYDAYYMKALQRSRKIRDLFENAFRSYDILITPASPVLPYDIRKEENTSPASEGSAASGQQRQARSDIYTAAMNLAGLPALSMQCGFSKTGLPIGLQLAAGHFAEDKLFRAAFSLELELGIAGRMPLLKGADQYV